MAMSCYDRENRNVLRRCLKTASDGAAVTWAGRSFHTAEPEAVNVWLPTVDRLPVEAMLVHMQGWPHMLGRAAHHRTCRTTASRSPVLTLGGICVWPTVNYLQCLDTGSTLTAVGPFQLPAPQSATLSRILSWTRPSVQTVSDVCSKCTCSLDTSCLLYTSDAADE